MFFNRMRLIVNAILPNLEGSNRCLASLMDLFFRVVSENHFTAIVAVRRGQVANDHIRLRGPLDEQQVTDDVFGQNEREKGELATARKGQYNGFGAELMGDKRNLKRPSALSTLERRVGVPALAGNSRLKAELPPVN